MNKQRKDWCIPLLKEYHPHSYRSIFMAILFVMLNFQSFGNLYKQKVSIDVKNVSLEEFINLVKDRYNVGFIYDYELIKSTDKKVSIDVIDQPLGDLLFSVLNGTGLTAVIDQETIIINKAPSYTLKKPIIQQEEKKQEPLIEIKGSVYDEQGDPLPGAAVKIKGTSLGTATDLEGNFELMIPTLKGTVLIFSFIGMETKEVRVLSEKALSVQLEPENSALEEVVVTGIYERKKESFTGSSSTYSGKDLKKIGNTNILQSLKTLDPAFAIMENNQYGSDPNRLPDVNVRGKTSLITIESEYGTDPNQPLFILDGFETTLQTIVDLSVDRVQSITVLKDAASTAIYGSKAANGVIVVETKVPKMGELQFNYNGSMSVTFADLTDYNLMNSAEKLEFEKLAGYYGKLDENGNIVSEVDEQIYNNRLAEVKRGVDTYWMNEPLRLGITHKHNVSAGGGDGRMRYLIGVNYASTDGVMKDSDREYLNGNVGLTYRLNSISFNNTLNIDYTVADNEIVPFSDFSQANPYQRKYGEDGEIYQIIEEYKKIQEDIYVFNPLYDTQLDNVDKAKDFTFRNNFRIEWSILQELKTTGRVGVSRGNRNSTQFYSPKSNRFYRGDKEEAGLFAENNANNWTFDADLNITYGKLLGEAHLVNMVAGMICRSNSNQSSGYSVSGFLGDEIINPSFSQGFQDGMKPTYYKAESRSASYYFNGGYDYRGRYLLDISYRHDGTSVFSSDKKFVSTWALGIAWNIHNERLFKENISWIDQFRLRSSIGNPGNQNFDAYISKNIYNYEAKYSNPSGLGVLISQWGNQELEWQKTIDRNFGMDFVGFRNRIKVTFDYFYKVTDPLLVQLALPASVGASTTWVNLGEQVTKGYTAILNLTMLQKQQSHWMLNLTARHLKDEYDNFGKHLEKLNKNNQNRNLTRYYDGGSSTDLWAVPSVGIDPITGREMFLKKDGTHTYKYDIKDEVVVGNTTPKLEGVVGTSFYYKGFSASINLRYRLGGQIFQQTLYNKVENITDDKLRYNQDKRALYDRWTTPGKEAPYKGISLTEVTPISSRFVADENTLSGESISLGYETSAHWLQNMGVSSLDLRASMNEIFRISTVKEERGIDYPFARSVSFSLSVRF